MMQVFIYCELSVFRRNMNMIDNMIRIMEKYTDNLEELVAERTKQLEDEKQKTDQLLYSMLPRYFKFSFKLHILKVF